MSKDGKMKIFDEIVTPDGERFQFDVSLYTEDIFENCIIVMQGPEMYGMLTVNLSAYGMHSGSSGIYINHDILSVNPDLVEEFEKAYCIPNLTREISYGYAKSLMMILKPEYESKMIDARKQILIDNPML